MAVSVAVSPSMFDDIYLGEQAGVGCFHTLHPSATLSLVVFRSLGGFMPTESPRKSRHLPCFSFSLSSRTRLLFSISSEAYAQVHLLLRIDPRRHSLAKATANDSTRVATQLP